MTREEEIEKASVHHLFQYDYSYEEGEHLDFYIKGFTDGAKWADEHPKNKWHSVDDVPTEQHDIICKDNKGKCWHCDWKYFYENYPNWKEFVETMNVQKWLYIHEL